MPSRFIVLEGPDGAGTTLHSRLLAERLEKEGHSVLLTTEPSNGPISEQIRQALKGNDGLPSSALQLLFCADRAWHVANVIEPALKEGKIVISDRYIPSTIIYGDVSDLDTDWLEEVNRLFPKPDCTIFALPPYEVCLERVNRRKEKDIFEESEFLRRIYEGYEVYASEDGSIRVVDTSGEKAEVAKRIYEATMIEN